MNRYKNLEDCELMSEFSQEKSHQAIFDTITDLANWEKSSILITSVMSHLSKFQILGCSSMRLNKLAKENVIRD